jgi:pimeloyl-ACP methyl ester carboxylesterase
MLGGCADKLILFPTRDPMSARGAERREVPFEGGHIEVFVARSPGATTRPVEAYVLRFLGNAERAEMNAAAAPAYEWGQKPVEMWSVQHAGFGNSTGPASLKRLPPAALAAYDAVAQEAKGKPILITGTSLGTTLALYTASKRDVAALVLRTPPPLKSLILGRHGWWNLWLAAVPVSMGVPEEMDALRTAPQVKAPALFVLIDTDEIIPLKYQQKVVDAYGGEKHVVLSEGGDHNSAISESAQAKAQQHLDELWEKAMSRRTR